MKERSFMVQGAVSAPYSINIRKDLSGLHECLGALELPAVRACIVTDSNVGPLYADLVREELERAGLSVHVFTLEAGEEHKTLDQIRDIYLSLVEHGLDRKDVLVALGGGVTGDMCGFAAATYLRGIDFIQVPTTLLSMVDSSVGGKTGVDLAGYKNMVGAFHQPRLVYMAVDTLRTLPPEQFASGMGEVIKHGLIRDASYAAWLEEHADAIRGLEPDILADMIFHSVRIKAEIVEQDPSEQNIRRLLNFGHTIGHAVEKETDFRLSHGQCVALGSIAAGRISADRGMISEEELAFMKRLFASFGLCTDLVSCQSSDGIAIPDRERVTDAMKHDKKKQGDRISFVLLEKIGEAVIRSDAAREEIIRGMEEISL